MPNACRCVPRRRAARTLALASSVLLGAALLAACGSSSAANGASSTPASVAATTSSPATAGLTLKDAWVKAAPNGMTAIFGTFTNPTGTDVTVVSGTTPAASKIEPHEVATVDGAMKMRPKVGGFVVPAHGNHELKPGGDHLMVMGLTAPIKAGDTVTAVLSLKDGSTVTINAIGKEYAGANESYQATGGAGMSMPAPGGPSMAASASMSK
jgi:copper(I)-binding protein